jgi:hypothetical protein
MMLAHKPGRDAPAVAFEAELVLQCPDDRLDALAEPVRERARLLLVLAGRADQGQAQVRAGEELLGSLPGQALARDDRGAGRRPVRRLALQRLPRLVPLAVQPRARQAEPGHGPLAGADQQRLLPQYQREWLGQYP